MGVPIAVEQTVTSINGTVFLPINAAQRGVLWSLGVLDPLATAGAGFSYALYCSSRAWASGALTPVAELYRLTADVTVASATIGTNAKGLNVPFTKAGSDTGSNGITTAIDRQLYLRLTAGAPLTLSLRLVYEDPSNL